MIKIYEGDDPPPLSLCARGKHAHESWPEYRECYAKLQEMYTYHWELQNLRGTKMHELCQVSVDIFADHAEAECTVGPGFENPSLLKFWDNPVGGFVRFIGTMVKHVRGAQRGPCPLCKEQEDQHDYTACLRIVHLEMRGDKLSVTTNKPLPMNPPSDPMPTTRSTPKNPQPVPISESTNAGTPKMPALVEGQYTCYRRPCINCTDPFPAHLTSECKEPTSPNVGLQLLWKMITHQGIQLFAQAQRWNMRQTEDREPCGVCQTELKEHDFRACIMRAQVQTDVWGRIKVQLSHPKEKLDKRLVEPRKHSHQTIEELKECFLKKKPMFESSQSEGSNANCS